MSSKTDSPTRNEFRGALLGTSSPAAWYIEEPPVATAFAGIVVFIAPRLLLLGGLVFIASAGAAGSWPVALITALPLWLYTLWFLFGPGLGAFTPFYGLMARDDPHMMLWMTLRNLPIYIAAMTASVATGTTLLAHSGAIDPSPPLETDGSFAPVLGYYVWQLADSIPALELSQTLGWESPVAFGDTFARALLLGYKLAVIIPVGALVLELIRLASNPLWQPEERAGREAFFLGVHRQKRGDLDKAEQAYKIADDHGFLDATNTLGTLAYARGDLASAEAAFRKADSQGDGYGSFNLGVLLHEKGDLENAEDAYRRASDRLCNDALYNLGLLLLERGDMAGAGTALKNAAARRSEGGLLAKRLLYERPYESDAVSGD